MAGAYVRLNPEAIHVLLESERGPVGVDLLKRCIRVEAAAKRLAPVDTGRLRSSITHEVGHDIRGLVGFVGSDVHYAIYQELGTRFMHAQPYLRPALAAAR